MANELATVGTLSYNGVEFGYMTRTTGVSVRPELSSDGRTVKYNAWAINFESTINGVNKAEVDAVATQCRRALTKVGGPFVLTDRAIGDIRVNVGPVRDVANGPIPTELSFEPAVGGNLTCKLRWSISFKIPECADASFRFRAMEFTYSVSYQINNGYTTRTVRGKLQIPQNRIANGVRFPQDSADHYREQIVGEPPEGFKPGPYNFQLSDDRATLTFDYSHVEMGWNVFPPGVVDATASQTYSSSGSVLQSWQTTINASYTLAKTADYRAAVRAFAKLVEDRRQAFNAARKGTAPTTWVMPVAYTASEPEIYGPRKVSLSITLTAVGPLQQVLSSGMWQQLPGQDRNSWRLWWLSVKDNAFHPRGTARLMYDIGEDRITDLCDTGLTRLKPDRKLGGVPVRGALPAELAGLFPTPPAANSWSFYHCTLTVEKDSGNALVRPMPTTELTADVLPKGGFDVGNILKSVVLNSVAGPFTPPLSGLGVGNNRPGPFAGGRLDNTQIKPDAVQGRGPAYFVYIDGWAVRFGYPIPEPSLKEYAGVKLMEMNRTDRGEGFSQAEVGYSTCPIYGAKWRLRYGADGDLTNKAGAVPQNILFPDAK